MSAISLRDNENVRYIARRHWWVLLIDALHIALISGIFIATLVFFVSQGTIVTFESGRFGGFVASLSAILFVTWTIGFITWMDYYLDVWIITDRRLIAIEQHGLFARSVAELRLERVQDVTVEVAGLVPTFFSFGTIHVQTAAEERRFSLVSAKDPHKIKEIISKASDSSIDERLKSITG